MASTVLGRVVACLEKPPQGQRCAFIMTAAEVEQGDKWWLQSDRDALTGAGFDVFDYTLTNKMPDTIEEDLCDVDMLFVSGGNTFFLLRQARQSGFDTLVKKMTENGTPYIGSSAGSILLGPDIEMFKLVDDPTDVYRMSSYQGLGLVDFITYPHWGNKHFRTAMQKEMEILYDLEQKFILLRDNQFVFVEGDSYKIM